MSAETEKDRRAIQERIQEYGFAVCEVSSAEPANELLNRAARIGTLDLDIDKELSGPPIMHIKYDPIKATRRDRPAYFSSEAFPLDTDMSYVVNPPRYLLMLCLMSDSSGGGYTTLSDCRSAWNALSRTDQSELASSQFRFRNPPNTLSGDSGALPMSYATPHWQMWRVRMDSMIFPACASEAVGAFSRSLEEYSISFALSAGQLLIVDNHRITHGRTAFDPSTSNTTRHLLRTYSQDPNRSAHLQRAINSPESY